MDDLNKIADQIRAEMSATTQARDNALAASRSLIRLCALSIRAAHRSDFDEARSHLDEASQLAAELRATADNHPDLYYAGYTQDGLKEYVEANLVLALIRQQPLPGPTDLDVIGATYLKGLAEASTEMRRRILDIIRKDQQLEEAERLLAAMDDIYTILITFDFPDNVTYGLRRATDVVRGVLERTRGDLTMSLRQQRLQQALQNIEQQVEK